MSFSVNFLVDPAGAAYGCWVTCSAAPLSIIEAAWATEETLPQANYLKGWIVQSYSHTDLDKALEFFWEIVREFEWSVLDTKVLEDLWFAGQPELSY